MTDDTERKTTSADDSAYSRGAAEPLRERLRQMVGEFRLPKELLSHMQNQVDETKNAAVAIVAREVRAYLEKTDLAEEVVKVLSRLSFDVSASIRFTDNQGSRSGVRFAVTDLPAEPQAASGPSGDGGEPVTAPVAAPESDAATADAATPARPGESGDPGDPLG
ncbi:MAG: hypothetical protein GX146_09060 [Myxococcales bacterium]|jgi:hypothetical protein|nr:hypothetical protein [Myxococcales bacterium]